MDKHPFALQGQITKRVPDLICHLKSTIQELAMWENHDRSSPPALIRIMVTSESFLQAMLYLPSCFLGLICPTFSFFPMEMECVRNMEKKEEGDTFPIPFQPLPFPSNSWPTPISFRKIMNSNRHKQPKLYLGSVGFILPPLTSILMQKDATPEC